MITLIAPGCIPEWREIEDPLSKTKELQTSGFRRLKRKIRDISNSQRLDSCVESCDHTLAVLQAAAFAVFFFDFDNGAAVTLADCLTAAQRLICA